MTDNPRLGSPKELVLPYGFQRNGRHYGMVLPGPGLPPQFDLSDMAAWKALNKGQAPQHLQERAMEHLAFITGFNADTFHADPYIHGYQSGRRSVFVNIFAICQTVTKQSTTSDGEQG